MMVLKDQSGPWLLSVYLQPGRQTFDSGTRSISWLPGKQVKQSIVFGVRDSFRWAREMFLAAEIFTKCFSKWLLPSGLPGLDKQLITDTV